MLLQLRAVAAPTLIAGAFAPAPVYIQRVLRTVKELWREWKEGIAGGPAVEQLEKEYGHHWRTDAQQKTWFCRRKVILDEVLRLVDSSIPLADAIKKLDSDRGSRSLNSFSDELRKQRKAGLWG
jgi:hypothetical protein